MDNLFDLPEMPEPFFFGWSRGGLLSADGFTADQMRAYALAAVEAEREACAKLAVVCPGYFATFKAAYKFAELIRERGKS